MVSVHGLLCTERRSGRNRRTGWACSSCCILWPSSEVRDIQRPQRYSFLGQHRAIASAVFDGSFVPILPFEKLDIHPVLLRFSNVVLCQTISPNSLAELCGAALELLRPEIQVIVGKRQGRCKHADSERQQSHFFITKCAGFWQGAHKTVI